MAYFVMSAWATMVNCVMLLMEESRGGDKRILHLDEM